MTVVPAARASDGVELPERSTPLEDTVELDFKGNVNLYLENLQSMGILHTDRMTYKTDRAIYEPLEERYKSRMASFQQQHKGTSLWAYGYYLITDYGSTFIEACTMKLQEPTANNSAN